MVYSLVEHNRNEMGYLDPTGKFPYKSAKGNQYFLVAYHYDANCIWAEPMKNRESNTITTAWEKIQKKFATAGTSPNTWILDNEASQELKTAIKDSGADY